MARQGLERQHSIAQYIACGNSEWLAWIWKDNILLHNTLRVVHSEWLALIWKDNILLHNKLRVVIANGSPGSGKTTFYCTIHCVWP